MYTYKFRLLFDEIEDFVRDYEILAEQTFKDFHDVIVKSITGLDKQELASFYICDGRWKKQQEITLIDMNMDDDSNPFVEEKTEEEQNIPKAIMSESVLSDFIDDPHQRLIYEYNFLNINTFYIELLKTFESSSKVKYPCCTYSACEMPNKQANLLDEELDIDIDEDTDDEENIDYYDEEDFKSLNDDIEV
jgi:hypothetical protein